MKGEDRRSSILKLLTDTKQPIKGAKLSQMFQVSRQVIVQDVAILRAEGFDIVATPQGYLFIGNKNNYVSRVIAVKHLRKDIEDELKTIVYLKGRVIDVTIEHKIYGEITGKLMITSMDDAQQFIEQLNKKNAKPLSSLTDGIHLHRIEADDDETMTNIINALKERGYLISQEV